MNFPARRCRASPTVIKEGCGVSAWQKLYVKERAVYIIIVSPIKNTSVTPQPAEKWGKNGVLSGESNAHQAKITIGCQGMESRATHNQRFMLHPR